MKLLVYEDGSALADEAWSRASSRVASRLIYPEARAALGAARRAQRIRARQHRAAVRDLDAAYAAVHLVGLDWDLAVTAGEVAERHALRGYDAVHLATALAIGGELVVVTWDRDLAHAAVSAGLPAMPATRDG